MAHVTKLNLKYHLNCSFLDQYEKCFSFFQLFPLIPVSRRSDDFDFLLSLEVEGKKTWQLRDPEAFSRYIPEPKMILVPSTTLSEKISSGKSDEIFGKWNEILPGKIFPRRIFFPGEIFPDEN